MSLMDTGSRTEPATPRRREEAREQGLVARSADLSGVTAFLAGTVLMSACGVGIVSSLLSAQSEAWGLLAVPSLTIPDVCRLSLRIGGEVGRALLPLAAGLLLAAVAAGALQVGLRLTPLALAPRAERIDPSSGVRRLLSVRSVLQLGMAFLKAAAVAGGIAWGLSEVAPGLADLADGTPAGILRGAGDALLACALRAGALLLFLGVADYALARGLHERDLRMTRAEAAEELKRHEGDAQLRQRRLRSRRELMKAAQARGAREADVVIVNPTTLAVALRYDPAGMEAPRVVAKGARTVADSIRDAARRAGVPVIEKTPLARALFRSCAVGQEVPPGLYPPVVEAFTFVHWLKRKEPVA